MHFQNRNPLRERDHRISLMPLVPAFDPANPKRGTIRRAIAGLFLFGIGWATVTLLVAALSTPRP